MSLYDIEGQLTAFRSLEFLAPCGLKDCTALLDDVGYILSAEINNLIGYKPAISAIDSFHFKPAEYRRACDGTDGGIHSGSISSGCEEFLHT